MDTRIVYKVGDTVHFDGCGTDGSHTDSGKVIYVDDNHVIVQMDYSGSIASFGFNRVGLPYEIVRNIIGEDISHNEFDRFVDILDEISLEYYNTTFAEGYSAKVFNVFGKMVGNQCYWTIADAPDFDDLMNTMELHGWSTFYPVEEHCIDEIICLIRSDDDGLPTIYTWNRAILRFGNEAVYSLKRNGYYEGPDKSSPSSAEIISIRAIKPIRI